MSTIYETNLIKVTIDDDGQYKIQIPEIGIADIPDLNVEFENVLTLSAMRGYQGQFTTTKGAN